MSQLVESLRTRIEDLTASVETQKSELAAYQRVLQIELAGTTSPIERIPAVSRPPVTPVPTTSMPDVDPTTIPFTGNKTALVAEIVKSHGSAGASSKEVEQVFKDRKIKRGDRFVYKTLVSLAEQKRLQRRDGRYYAVGSVAVSKTGGLVTAKKKSGGVSPTKKKMSPAAIKKIREGVKKYWAAKKAAAR